MAFSINTPLNVIGHAVSPKTWLPTFRQGMFVITDFLRESGQCGKGKKEGYEKLATFFAPAIQRGHCQPASELDKQCVNGTGSPANAASKWFHSYEKSGCKKKWMQRFSLAYNLQRTCHIEGVSSTTQIPEQHAAENLLQFNPQNHQCQHGTDTPCWT